MNISNLTKILEEIYLQELPLVDDLVQVLSLDTPEELKTLFSFADKIRQEFCGDGILLRGIIEFSNFCSRDCFYCGLNKKNHKLVRYRMTQEELLKSVSYLASCNIKTVVLQSGEDEGLNVSWLKDVILEIKARFNIAITLSVGERERNDYKVWKQAGANRYLLKIETANEVLYNQVHAGMDFKRRKDCLNNLRSLGYQVGSGSVIGLPGQTLVNIAQDILFFKQNDFDMIGIGPFIAHPDTIFAKAPSGQAMLTLKALALTRIVTKNAYLPATTALGSLDQDYRLDGLRSGANVLMPNFTPQPWRKLYEIYPGKRCVDEPVGTCNFCMDEMTKSLGRFIDYSLGDTLKFRKVKSNV